MKKQWLKLITLGLLMALLGAACQRQQTQETTKPGDSPKSVAKADFAQTYTEIREAYSHMFMTADGLAAAIAKQKGLGETTNKAIDTRQVLDKQLGEHAFLAVFAMQKGLDGAEDFEAIGKALDGNSVDLSATIASVYEKEAGDAFLKQWRDHIRMFVDFTVATAKNDQSGRQKALEELSQYKESFAKFLTENTGLERDTGLKASAVAGLLQDHVDQLTAALDSYKAKDYTKTYEQVREAYAHMYMTGDGLAAAIAKQKNLGDTSGKGADTRILLDRLLSEHAALATMAMQKGAQNKPDFEAIAGALDQNSQDLANTVGSVYGKDAGDAFLKQWRDHIRMFVDFTAATAKGDDNARDTALEELSQYKDSFARFLTENTGLSKDAGLEAAAVAGLLQEHVDQLTSALDSFLGKKS